ncbi:MAG TPA: alkaline phosphatase family protein, partial [Aquabacterium sp.]|nr:alkaline phosphatase family protein [Aquabacterium sp.]
MKHLQWLSSAVVACLAAMMSGSLKAQPAPWRPDHTVIVVLENLSAFEATPAQRSLGNAPVYGRSNWTFFNQLADKGARFTRSSFAQTPYGSGLPTRPSQPNYLFLFSGHHQGVLPGWFVDERSPYTGTALRDRQGRPLSHSQQSPVGVANNAIPDRWLPFTSPNLGAAIMKTGGSFAMFSESLPYPSWNCSTDSSLVPCTQSWALTDLYRRKHNPAINWTDQLAPTSERGLHGDLEHNILPVTVNLAFDPTHDPALKRSFRGFMKDEKGQGLGFEHLPTVSVVVPNEQNDAHSNSAESSDGWLQRNLGSYAQWAMTHNSLLILTFDEDGSTDSSHG